MLLRSRITSAAWAGVALSTGGLALLSGVHAGSSAGDLLVLAGAAVYSLQIVLMERYAPRYDAIAFTLVEMLAACVGLGVVAVVRGDHGRHPPGRARRRGHAQGRGSEAAYNASLTSAGRVGRPWTCTATTREPLKTVPV